MSKEVKTSRPPKLRKVEPLALDAKLLVQMHELMVKSRVPIVTVAPSM